MKPEQHEPAVGPAKPTAPSPLIPPAWQVPEVIRRRLGRRVGKQRVMHADGHLLLVLHEPPTPDDNVRTGKLFWRDAEGKWSPSGLKHDELALGELLQEYKKRLDKLEVDEDTATSARDYFEVLRHLNPLARTVTNLHNVLQHARDVCKEAPELIHARDTAYGLQRQAELLQKEAQHSLDFEVARQAEMQAESAHRMAVSSHRLNLLVAFFFPLATIAGIFGMNLHHGVEWWDESSGPLPLFVIVGVGFVLGSILTMFVMTKAGKQKSSRDNRK